VKQYQGIQFGWWLLLYIMISLLFIKMISFSNAKVPHPLGSPRLGRAHFLSLTRRKGRWWIPTNISYDGRSHVTSMHMTSAPTKPTNNHGICGWMDGCCFFIARGIIYIYLYIYSPGSPSRPLKNWMFTKSTIFFSRAFESSKIADCYSKSRWLTSRIEKNTSGEYL